MFICGDYCTGKNETCTCGTNTYAQSDMISQNVYCCNYASCYQNGTNSICEKAEIKPVEKNCQNECPYSERISMIQYHE